MGLLDMLMPYSQTTGYGPQKTTNPFTGWFDQNRGKIAGAFGGMVGAGNDPRAALTGFVGGLQHGVSVDQENAIIRQQQEQQAAQVKAQQDQQAAQIDYLTKNAPQYAPLLAAGFLSPTDVGKQLTATDMPTNDPASVAEYKFYANQELKAGRKPASYADWRKGANQTVRAGMGAPIWGKNRKSLEYMPFEPMSDGTISSLVDPNANPADFIFDPGTVASDKAAGAAFGGLQGAQQYNLPKSAQDVQTEMGNIDAIMADSAGLEEIFGRLGGVIPQQWLPDTPGTPKANMRERIKQVVGENFLNAYSTLRGGGAITETEGSKAQEAMARLSTAQSKEAFLQALNDLKAILQVGYQRMSGQATMGPYQSSGFTPPPLAGQNFTGNTTSSGVQWSVSP